MSEQTNQMERVLVDILKSVTESAQKASDFVIAELPDVVQQLLTWKFAESLAYCLFAIALAVIWIVVERTLIKYGKKVKWEDETWLYVYGVFGSFARFFIVLAIVVSFNIKWLQIWLAPKVYLIEYAASLVK